MSTPSFAQAIKDARVALAPRSLSTLQVNLTRTCNQACAHCHLEAGPTRREALTADNVGHVLRILAQNPGIRTLDLTGGAPELHPDFRDLVMRARELGTHVMVRHNLTVAVDPHPITGESLADLPEFFAANGVEVVSSLPHYSPYLTDRQRGAHVFEKSIGQMRALNEVGYGHAESGLELDLVHNPVGPYLPADQAQLERDYRASLRREFGLEFTRLFTLVNMPISRFLGQLEALGSADEYRARLANSFNPCAAANVMCRDLVSVGPDGTLYDCDFNQALDLPLRAGSGAQLAPTPMTLATFDLAAVLARRIEIDDHCYGCSAGAGSSCGGATT